MSNLISVLPAVIDMQQVATVLGFSIGGVSVLVAKGELPPLGNPAPNAPKYFARCDIEEKAQDKKWLHRATKIISAEWKKKNDARRSKHRDNETNWTPKESARR